jgi:ribonuclease J
MKVETKNAAEEKVITPSALAASPGQFILCFSLTDMVNLLDIGPEGGTYVYSNSEAFDEGQEIRFGLLAAWLGRFRIRPVGFEMVENGGHILPRFLRGFHASGHASSSDLIEIVRGIGPEIVVPVHTTAPEVFLEIDGVKTIVPERSVPIRL